MSPFVDEEGEAERDPMHWDTWAGRGLSAAAAAAPARAARVARGLRRSPVKQAGRGFVPIYR